MNQVVDWNVKAQLAMAEIDPNLVGQFATLIAFLIANPESGKSPKSEADLRGRALSYAGSREPKHPKRPATVPDDLVSFILNVYFEVPAEQLDRAKEQHLLSMAAENTVGDLLERYLANILEPEGWVWCAGSIVTAVDFIMRGDAGNWNLLQIKNRDNLTLPSKNVSLSAMIMLPSVAGWQANFSRTPLG